MKLAAPAASDLVPIARERFLREAQDRLTHLLEGPVAAYARERADALANDHERLRAAGPGAPRVEVEAILPADVIGLFVLLPQVV